ncbi:MAG: putative toxin-antitoxin system toxin component, PIN family [Anaerolineales bacterium]|nr:putative toxin-antitoxin system toxin component, PIN family [Anaerolineales bacterium]
MIVVLDTNLIISALLSPQGTPAKIIGLWEEGKFDVAVSAPLLNELERALGYERIKKYFRGTDFKKSLFIKHLQETAIFVKPQINLEVIADDPDDNRLLECAVTSGSLYIISGDQHLLDLKEYQGIQILSPAGFVVLLELK